MGLEEFGEPGAKRLLVRAFDPYSDFSAGFQTKHDQLQGRSEGAGSRFRRDQNFTRVGAPFLHQNSRRPAVDTGLVLYRCFRFKHFIQVTVR